jgi:hypothetical protein
MMLMDVEPHVSVGNASCATVTASAHTVSETNTLSLEGISQSFASNFTKAYI